MAESAARVLAALDFGREPVLRDGQQHVRGVAVRQLRKTPDAHVEAQAVARLVLFGRAREAHFRLRLARGLRDCLEGLAVVAAGELRPTVHNHLRRIDAGVAEGRGVLVLPLAELVRGEGV